MPIQSDLLRQAMRSWATGVTIVTSRHEAVTHGMTVSSFTSISVEPPRVLISIATNARTHDLIERAGVFGVTILATTQQDLSDRFAGRVPDEMDRLAGLETFTLETGVPLLAGGLANFDCRVVQTYYSGTNTLFIGEVVAARSAEGGDPLLYFSRGYHRLTE
jgi:flavin reductase (DIM6/NTAB) family NADH-FMN oxidoreductase RutF